MRNALLEPARGVAPAAVLFAALALGVGKPAWGNASVTEEQAQAAAVAARIADDEASDAPHLRRADDHVDDCTGYLLQRREGGLCIGRRF